MVGRPILAASGFQPDRRATLALAASPNQSRDRELGSVG